MTNMNTGDRTGMHASTATPVSQRELMKAAARNDLATLRRYVEQGGVVDVVVDSAKPLIVAIDHGSTAFALAALGAGARCDGPDRGRNALHAAVERGDVAVVSRLLRLGDVLAFRLNDGDDEKRPPLYLAAIHARAAIAGMLLAAGAARDSFYMDVTAAQQAALGDASAEARATLFSFIEREHDPVAFLSAKPADDSCDSIVQLVASQGGAEMLGFLLDQGVPVDTDYGSGTPFWRACTTGNTDCLAELARRGAAPAWTEFSAMTLALTMCPQRRRAGTITALLELGLDPDEPDGKGRVPREMAQTDHEVLQVLAAHEARCAMAAVLGAQSCDTKARKK